MPDANNVISSLLLNIANIVLLFVIMRSLVYKPVKKFMDARAAGIEVKLKDAEKLRTEAEAMHLENTERLAAGTEETEAEKHRILSAAETKAAEITAEAEKTADQLISSAEVQAKHVVEQKMDDMYDEIADLSVEIAGRILEREISRGDNADIIDKFFDRVG